MVKVLVATTEAQGDRTDDYASAVDGELVYVPVTGCDRGFAGMASNLGTTTAMVVERLDLSVDHLWTALSDSLTRQGVLGDEWTDHDHEVFRRLFQRMLATASHFPIGSIVEREGERIRRRAQAEPMSVPSNVVGGEG